MIYFFALIILNLLFYFFAKNTALLSYTNNFPFVNNLFLNRGIFLIISNIILLGINFYLVFQKTWYKFLTNFLLALSVFAAWILFWWQPNLQNTLNQLWLLTINLWVFLALPTIKSNFQPSKYINYLAIFCIACTYYFVIFLDYINIYFGIILPLTGVLILFLNNSKYWKHIFIAQAAALILALLEKPEYIRNGILQKKFELPIFNVAENVNTWLYIILSLVIVTAVLIFYQAFIGNNIELSPKDDQENLEIKEYKELNAYIALNLIVLLCSFLPIFITYRIDQILVMPFLLPFLSLLSFIILRISKNRYFNYIAIILGCIIIFVGIRSLINFV